MEQMIVELDAAVVRTHTAISTDISGEAAVVDLETGRYLSLDPIATTIWNRLETPRKISELCAELAKEFDGEPGLIARDTRDFLTRLIDRGLVRTE